MTRVGEPRDGTTRREMMRTALAGGAVLAGGSLLAACGSSSSSASSATTVPASQIKPGGNLRIGSTGGGASDSIDAHIAVSDPDIARIHQLYEPLAIRDPDFNFKMVLAESMTPASKPDVWTIKLRPGVSFHNGKPVTADDVLYSIHRMIKLPGSTAAASIGYVDLGATKKLDKSTVQVKLMFPNISFPDDIGQYFNGIVPVGYDPKNPIGTGPFKYQSFSPGQQSVFMKFDSYWNGPAHVDSVTIIDFADDTAKVNALLGSQADAVTNLPGAQLSQIKGSSGLAPLISQSGAWQPFTMRVDVAPFSDVRVRQAMRLIVNRQQMIEQALLGQGRVANDLYAPYDPAYNSSLAQRYRTWSRRSRCSSRPATAT